MKALKSAAVKRILGVLNNSIVKSVILLVLCFCLILVQLFFPYWYFSSADRNSGAFQVGIHYVYEQDTVSQIATEVSRIHDLGFKVIRVTLEYDQLNAESTRRTDAFYTAARNQEMPIALVVSNHLDPGIIRYYLTRWGNNLAYIQVLNEPEASQSWDAGALFTDDEIITKFDETYALVDPYRSQAKLYTNFGPGFLVRTNIPIQISKNLDFVGLDVYMESFLAMSPNFVTLLHKMTQKDVVITEYGMSSSNDTAQSDFIIRGLNLFKSMGLNGCWLTYWNSAGDNYGIRGRLAEQTVRDWIAENAKTD